MNNHLELNKDQFEIELSKLNTLDDIQMTKYGYIRYRLMPKRFGYYRVFETTKAKGQQLTANVEPVGGPMPSLEYAQKTFAFFVAFGHKEAN